MTMLMRRAKMSRARNFWRAQLRWSGHLVLATPSIAMGAPEHRLFS
jgi:hypothetical protein